MGKIVTVIHEAGDDVPIQASGLASAYSRNSCFFCQTCVILYFVGDLLLHLHGMVSLLSIYNKIESPNTFILVSSNNKTTTTYKWNTIERKHNSVKCNPLFECTVTIMYVIFLVKTFDLVTLYTLSVCLFWSVGL